MLKDGSIEPTGIVTGTVPEFNEPKYVVHNSSDKAIVHSTSGVTSNPMNAGATVGIPFTITTGFTIGLTDGTALGNDAGVALGLAVGTALGTAVGLADGFALG